MRDSRPLLERLVALVSPRRALLMQHNRLMETDRRYRETFGAIDRARKGYRAAKSPEGATPWVGAGSGPDDEVSADRQKLIDRSREASRDDPIASGLIGTWVSRVVGTGLVAQPQPLAADGGPDREKAARLDAVWRELRDNVARVDRQDYGAHQRTTYARVPEDGDVLVVAVKDGPNEPVWFEVVESDRIATPMGAKPEDPAGRIVDGIEKDAQGRPVAAWVLAATLPGGRLAANVKDYRRVSLDRAYFLKRRGRPGQTRGVPLCHAVMQDLRDMDLLILAALKRVQIAACLAAFIESDAALQDFLPDTTEQTHGFRLDQDIEPGMIWKLFPGEKVSTLTPSFPTPELEPFIVMLARRVGAALGVSWQIVLKDFSQANYSSARTDILEAEPVFLIEQQDLAGLLSWERVMVLEDARLRGDPRLADCTAADIRAVRWVPNGRKWVDPQKEAMAIAVAMEIGILTFRDACDAAGVSWEAQILQSVEEERFYAEARAKAGLAPAQQSSGSVLRALIPLALREDREAA